MPQQNDIPLSIVYAYRNITDEKMNQRNRLLALLGAAAILVVASVVLWMGLPSSDMDVILLAQQSASIRVFGPNAQPDYFSDNEKISFQFYTHSEQRQFLEQHGHLCSLPLADENRLLDRFDELPLEYATELWKYCMLYTGLGNLYWDADNAKSFVAWDSLLPSTSNVNVAVQMDSSTSEGRYFENERSELVQVHHSLMYIPKAKSRVCLEMMRLVLETDLYALDPVRLSEALGLYIKSDTQKWNFLSARCPLVDDAPSSVDGVVLGKPVSRLDRHVQPEPRSRPCPMVHGGYCCQVWKPGDYSWPLLAIRHPFIVPTKLEHPLPYTFANVVPTIALDETKLAMSADQVPYIATVREIPTGNPPVTPFETPNFFDILLENNCLPSSRECFRCLKRGLKEEEQGGNCEVCQDICACYCKILCSIRPPPKIIAAELTVRRPLYRRDPGRLIPRIIHQTWYEPVTKEKYPNMSRLIESFRQSGWEYQFYDDDKAAQFLSAHFPPQVREAYDAILPGAFKADLFRYCVLLVRGGVYADMDVLLESNLDQAIDADVGFMTAQDEPGEPIDHRSCLWNGFLAAAPGHPFLAKTIENVVNNIRNRFTSVDYDDMLCPDPVLSVSHTVDVLFTCGPCVLGASINDILGRHRQTTFEYGEIDLFEVERQTMDTNTVVVDPDDPRLKIPGRSILLRQNKKDMGAHRFTLDEYNVVVASTDLPEYDDRPKSIAHYSSTHEQFGIYGLHKLYADDHRANEEIRITVQA